jgi:exonuclease SbcD
MKRKASYPILLLSTDWHLRRDNIEIIKDLVIQMCDLGDEINLKKVALLGDIFDKRKGQEQIVLVAFKEILDYIHSRGITVILFPGNHDKCDYDSSDSYLDPFADHPCVRFFREPTKILLNNDVELYIMPFYSSDIYRERLKNFERSEPIRYRVCLSHVGLDGSVNWNGTKLESPVKTSDFKDFDLTLLGHYHNHHKVTKDIVHLPSIYQSSFGEDNNKGFTILYSDLSWEISKSKFKEYRRVEIFVEDVMNGHLDLLMKNYDTEKEVIRLIIKGKREEIQSLPITELENKYKIDIQAQNEEVSDCIEYVNSIESMEFSSSTILTAFKEFCTENNFDFETGVIYLNKAIENGIK